VKFYSKDPCYKGLQNAQFSAEEYHLKGNDHNGKEKQKKVHQARNLHEIALQILFDAKSQMFIWGYATELLDNHVYMEKLADQNKLMSLSSRSACD
jgi:hypothetical protein